MECSLALLGWLVLPVPTRVLAQDSTNRPMHEMHRLHQNSKAYIAMLDDPKRDAYQKPHEVITALKLKEGEVIADIGAGLGYFNFRLAHHVGDAGRVYSLITTARCEASWNASQTTVLPLRTFPCGRSRRHGLHSCHVADA